MANMCTGATDGHSLWDVSPMSDIYDKLAAKTLSFADSEDSFKEYAAYLRTEIAKTHVPRARVETAIEVRVQSAADVDDHCDPVEIGIELALLRELLEDK